jgi:hypothetical protein
MKYRILGIPVIIAVAAVLIPLVAFAAYLIVTLTGQVTVKESITVTPTTFTASMYPGESSVQSLALSNASSVATDVSFTSSISPVTSEVTLNAPNKVTVPATGSAMAQVSVVASKSAAPGTYTVSIGLTR